LAAYLKTASLRAAAEAAEVNGSLHYRWLEEFPGYRSAFADVQLAVVDTLRDQVMELALRGWLEPIRYRGRKCAAVRRYSDRLLMFMLKAVRPEQYRSPNAKGNIEPWRRP
jgi:hypothetical protein